MRVRVPFKFWKNAHVRAMCVWPKIECANVRACEAKNRRNSLFGVKCGRESKIKSKKAEIHDSLKITWFSMCLVEAMLKGFIFYFCCKFNH